VVELYQVLLISPGLALPVIIIGPTKNRFVKREMIIVDTIIVENNFIFIIFTVSPCFINRDMIIHITVTILKKTIYKPI